MSYSIINRPLLMTAGNLDYNRRGFRNHFFHLRTLQPGSSVAGVIAGARVSGCLSSQQEERHTELIIHTPTVLEAECKHDGALR